MLIKTKNILPTGWQLKLGLSLLGLIIIPSFFLAYFSIRAVEAERLVYRQQLKESYLRLGQFATADIYQLIESLGEKWLEEIYPAKLMNLDLNAQQKRLDSLVAAHGIINNAYLVMNTGSVVYPVELNDVATDPYTESIPETMPEFDTWLLKFRELSEQADKFEFEKNNPGAAIDIYRKIINTFPIPRFRAIALGELARIYVFRAEWQIAYNHYRQIIQSYPGARDMNNLHLRFYAQHQCVELLENLGRLDEAMEALLALYRDLLEHSDEINRNQYEFFIERIQKFFLRFISAYSGERQEAYLAVYHELQVEKKKSIDARYLVQKLHQRLSKEIIEKTTYRERFKYFSDFAVEQPYLVAYIYLSKSDRHIVEAVLGLELNLEQLKAQIFSQIVSNINFPENVAIAILDEKNKFIMGEADKIMTEPAVLLMLRSPLDFWRFGIFPTYNNPLMDEGNYQAYWKFWGIFLLCLIILSGSVWVIHNMRKQQILSLQKTTFISSITHELKTPLTSIKMFVDLLSKIKPLYAKPEAQKYLKVINDESERLTKLVDNILDYSKIERGVKKYHFEYEEIGSVIRTVVDTFCYQGQLHGFKIELDMDDPFQEVYIDRNAIIQALVNLLSNAIKYSPNKKQVQIKVRRNCQLLNIQVRDRGIGIEKKKLKYIFDDFYRVEEGKAANIAGTGLGLALVKHIAEAHGGSVMVESIYGRGSTFILKLPINEVNHGKNIDC